MLFGECSSGLESIAWDGVKDFSSLLKQEFESHNPFMGMAGFEKKRPYFKLLERNSGTVGPHNQVNPIKTLANLA